MSKVFDLSFLQNAKCKRLSKEEYFVKIYKPKLNVNIYTHTYTYMNYMKKKQYQSPRNKNHKITEKN